METVFIREVSARYSKTRRKKFGISKAKDVADFVRSKVLKDNTKEHFILLSLDASHKVISYSVISVGTANYSVVHPREVFQVAILSGAVAIIVAHNHPSGSSLPSDADHEVTKKLKDAGEVLGIKVLDHVIIGDVSHHSFLENGPVTFSKGGR